MAEKECSHSYGVNEVTVPIGPTSDGKGAVVRVEKHSFCPKCGDLQVQQTGTREVR